MIAHIISSNNYTWTLLCSQACDSVNPTALCECASVGPCIKWVVIGVIFFFGGLGGGSRAAQSGCWGEL